jgi:Protein of unknown function (DUF3298)
MCNRKTSLLMSFILVITSACSALAAPATATPTAAPTATSAPTAAPVPLYQQVTMTSVPSEEDGQSPDSKITAQTPKLTGSADPRVQAFNKEASDLVQSVIADYKKNLAQMPTTPITASSTFDVQYKSLLPAGNTVSIKFDTEGYVAGMAHPYHMSYTLNYDLAKGKDIALSDLFLPGTDYLGALSKYCAAQLSTRDINFQEFSQGADPTATNYKNWNIKPDGLMITFDEYQVAAYVAGPQTVTVPYSELKSLIDPNGALASFTH